LYIFNGTSVSNEGKIEKLLGKHDKIIKQLPISKTSAFSHFHQQLGKTEEINDQ